MPIDPLLQQLTTGVSNNGNVQDTTPVQPPVAAPVSISTPPQPNLDATYKDQPWYQLYQQIHASNNPNLPTDPVTRSQQAAVIAQHIYHNAVPGSQFGEDYAQSIKDQGGYGLSPETKAALGHVNNPSLSNILPDVADLAYRGYQAGMAGLGAGASALDRSIADTGINKYSQKLFGNDIAPGAGGMALMEAFPEGGVSHGFHAPPGDTMAPEARAAFNAESNKLYANPYTTRADFEALSQKFGAIPPGPELDTALASRPKPNANDLGTPADVIPTAEAPVHTQAATPGSAFDPVAAAAQKAKLDALTAPQAADEATGLMHPASEIRPTTDTTTAAEVKPTEEARFTPVEQTNPEASVPVEPTKAPTDAAADAAAVEPTKPPFEPLSDAAHTAEGAPDQLTFPNGNQLAVDIRSNEGLKQLLRERGIDPDRLAEMTDPHRVEMVVQDAAAADPRIAPMLSHDTVTPEGEPGQPPRPANNNEPEGTGGNTGGPGNPPIDHEDVANRLTAALNDAGKVLPQQRELYREARSERVNKLNQSLAMGEGEEGAHQALSQLRGELPKADFESVRDNFTQPEIDSLFDGIKNHPTMSGFGKARAITGLGKLLDGKLPIASEISELRKAFGPDFVKAAMTNRSVMHKALGPIMNALNLPRAIMSSFDLSAPFTQGFALVTRAEFWNNFHSMLKAFGSERAYKGIMDDIYSRPTWPAMQEAKLAMSDISHELNDREEAFMSNWAEKIPVAGRVIRASERAYTAFLNKVRADTFDSMHKLISARGPDYLEQYPDALNNAARFLNAATGKGNLGKTLNSAAPLLNNMFFSPRLMASRVELLNPLTYIKQDPIVRQEAIRAMLGAGALSYVVLHTAKMAGWGVELDPRSSDFGKVVINNTHYNVTGGFNSYITLAARLLTNKTFSAAAGATELGQKFGQPTRLDVVGKFLQSKFSPVTGFVADYLRGKNYVGQAFDVRTEAANMFVPLFVQDLTDAVSSESENGNNYTPGSIAKGSAMSLPGLFGIPMNTYSPIPPAPSSIRFNKQDVPLNYAARNQYSNMLQSYYDSAMKPVKESGDWDKYTPQQQAQMKQAIIKAGKQAVKEELFQPATTTTTAASAAPTSNPVIPTAGADTAPPVTANSMAQIKPGEPMFDGFDGIPTSVRRTVAGNEAVGGVSNSDHLKGDAVDFVPPKGISMGELHAQAQNYFKSVPGVKIINEGDHLHIHIPGLNGPLFGKKGTAQ